MTLAAGQALQPTFALNPPGIGRFRVTAFVQQGRAGAVLRTITTEIPDFDKMGLQARSELDEVKRKALYRQLALTVRDDGGLILPVFNDYIMASSKTLKGYVDDIGNDLSNGYIGSRVWFNA